MTVQNLIQKLEKFNLESQVTFNSIIEQGRGVSLLENGDVSIEEIDGGIVVEISGEETDYN